MKIYIGTVGCICETLFFYRLYSVKRRPTLERVVTFLAAPNPDHSITKFKQIAPWDYSQCVTYWSFTHTGVTILKRYPSLDLCPLGNGQITPWIRLIMARNVKARVTETIEIIKHIFGCYRSVCEWITWIDSYCSVHILMLFVRLICLNACYVIIVLYA